MFMPNIYNLFKFLEKNKGTKTPFIAKLLYAPDELTDEDLNVEGDLYLSYPKITSLPDNLKVGGDLDLENTRIKSLPDGLKVEGTLYLYDTPFAFNAFTDEEIKKMIEGKGGYVKGRIYV